MARVEQGQLSLDGPITRHLPDFEDPSGLPVSGEPAVWHTGVRFGSTASLMHFPRTDTTIAVATNQGYALIRVEVPELGLSDPLLRQGENEFATPGTPTYRLWFEPAGERAERVIFEWAEVRSLGRRVNPAPEP